MLRAIIIIAMCIAGITQTWLEFTVKSSLENIHRSAVNLSSPQAAMRQIGGMDDLDALIQKTKRLSSIGRKNAEVNYQLGRLYLLASLNTIKTEDKISWYCNALDSFWKASKNSPHNPGYHIAATDILNQLRRPDLLCPDLEQIKHVGGLNVGQQLKWAQTLSPWGTVELYLASLVYLASGNKLDALELLRVNQEINPRFTPEQREFTYQLVRTETDLKQALPSRYPEIISWINHFSSKREDDYLAWQKTFETSADGALTELRERLHKNRISTEHYSYFVKNIASLPITNSSELLRKRLDQILANIYQVEGNSDWAKLLAERASLDRLPVLKSLILDDKDPKRTMLFNWVPDNTRLRADLDVLGRSIGIFIPPRMQPRFLMLVGRASSLRIEPKSLELLASKDNLNFHPLNLSPEIHKVDSRQNVIFSLENLDAPYLKIRYLGANRTATFSNSFAELLQLYGVVYQ